MRTRTLAATCALALALAGCSASSGAPTPLGQSGGAPLGGGADNSTSNSPYDASTSGSTPGDGEDAGAPSTAEGGASETGDGGNAGDATATTDGEAGVGDGAAMGDGGVDGAVEAAVEAGGAAMPNFSLIDTGVTGVLAGSGVTGFDPMVEGTTFSLGKVAAPSVRANTVPAAVGSVGFALDGSYTHTENTAPYMLCGDDGAGTITSCATVLTAGAHKLAMTPYSAASLGGTAGTPVTIDFTITP